MAAKKLVVIVLVLVCLSAVQARAIGASPEASEMQKQEFQQELARIKALQESLTSGRTNDLTKYEKFADGIQQKWSQRNKEYYARLMEAVCWTLSRGSFKDRRGEYEVARKYALSALEDPDAIPVTLEFELIRHLTLATSGLRKPNPPKGEDFARRRRKDVEIQLHAWKRLVDAIDPNWDPDERLSLTAPIPPGVVSLDSGMSPDRIKDPRLRAEYEAAIEQHRQKQERRTEQHRLRLCMKRLLKPAETYIIRAYSKPPFKFAELEQLLKDYMADEKTKARILDTVTKNGGGQKE